MGLSPVWDFIKSPFGFNANAPLLSLWKYEAEIHTNFLGLNFSGIFKTISPYNFPINALPLSIVKVISPAIFVILPYVKFGISKMYSSNFDKFSTVENLNTKHKADIASITFFRLGFNSSTVINTSKIKDKAIVYVTVKTDNMYVSTQLPKNINRAMLVHGTNARTAIISIEETGFFLYGDITGMTGIYLSEYVYC